VLALALVVPLVVVELVVVVGLEVRERGEPKDLVPLRFHRVLFSELWLASPPVVVSKLWCGGVVV